MYRLFKFTVNEMIDLERSALRSNQIFHYTRCITPKCVTSLWGPSLRHCAWQHSSFWRNVTTGVSHWQHCVWFDQPENWTLHLPLQIQMRYPSSKWPMCFKIILKLKLIPPPSTKFTLSDNIWPVRIFSVNYLKFSYFLTEFNAEILTEISS